MPFHRLIFLPAKLAGSFNLLLCCLLSCLFFALPAHSAAKTILVLGDSLSAEYGLARGTGWVQLLGQKLETEKINAAIVNASISGETSSGGKTRLPALIDKHKPSIVIIELGGNDALRGLSLAASEANLRSMITTSKDARAAVLLAGMQIPPNYGASYSQAFTAMYDKLAKEHKLAFTPFLLAGFADKLDYFQADRIHPNSQAQVLILANVWPQLQGLLKK